MLTYFTTYLRAIFSTINISIYLQVKWTGQQPTRAFCTKNELISPYNAIRLVQVPRIRSAAALYNVSESTLRYRKRGHVAQRDTQVNNRKLTATEEQALIDRIISFDERGLSPTLPLVRRMADLLLSQCAAGSSVGKNWLTRFVQRHNELMLKYLRKSDHQRAKCEDPETASNWFNLLRATVAKYGIVTEDIYITSTRQGSRWG